MSVCCGSTEVMWSFEQRVALSSVGLMAGLASSWGRLAEGGLCALLHESGAERPLLVIHLGVGEFACWVRAQLVRAFYICAACPTARISLCSFESYPNVCFMSVYMLARITPASSAVYVGSCLPGSCHSLYHSPQSLASCSQGAVMRGLQARNASIMRTKGIRMFQV